jgi:hypothetical protein
MNEERTGVCLRQVEHIRGREFAKFRCDVAPLKIETELLFENKICFNNPCRINNCIEDEKHDLLDCQRLGLLCLTPLLTIFQLYCGLDCPVYEDFCHNLFNHVCL